MESIISSLEMRNLIFEALSITDEGKTPRKQTFRDYGYRGCIADLFAIVEFMAVERGMVKKLVDIPMAAWGAPGYSLFYQSNTSFTPDNLDVFFEEFHFLINQNVLSPGAYGNYGADLPYFHVTKYGLQCIEVRDILPFDPNSYIAKIKKAGADEWEEYYVDQALKCYNAGAWNASVAMIGLAGEYLAEQLIGSFSTFLRVNEKQRFINFNTEIESKKHISKKMLIYEKHLRKVEDKKVSKGKLKYPDLTKIHSSLDDSAKSIYATFLRLTRNEVAHPSSLKLDKNETLMIFITYIKYCETQYRYISYFNTNS